MSGGQGGSSRGSGGSGWTLEATATALDFIGNVRGSAMKRCGALTHTTTWMDPEHTVLSERHQTQRPHSVRSHFCEMPGTDNSTYRTWFVGVRGWGRGRGVTANGDKFAFWGDKDVLR